MFELILPRGVRLKIYTVHRYYVDANYQRTRPPEPDFYVFRFQRADGRYWQDRVPAARLAADGFWHWLELLWPVMQAALK